MGLNKTSENVKY